MTKYYLLTIIALCAIGLVLFRSLESRPEVVRTDDVAPATARMVDEPALESPFQSDERSHIGADLPSGVQVPEVVATNSSEKTEEQDRSDWTVYQWRDLHAQNWLNTFSTSTALDERVYALKSVGGIAIANILDSRGMGLVNGEVHPSNSENSWGFSLNGVTYEFQDQDFPEYQSLLDIQSRLFTKPEPGETREISDELEQQVLDRLAESLDAVKSLGRGPSYHNR